MFSEGPAFTPKVDFFVILGQFRGPFWSPLGAFLSIFLRSVFKIKKLRLGSSTKRWVGGRGGPGGGGGGFASELCKGFLHNRLYDCYSVSKSQGPGCFWRVTLRFLKIVINGSRIKMTGSYSVRTQPLP